MSATYTIHLDAALWDEGLVAGLIRRGHKVIQLETKPDELYLSYRAWRIPNDIGQCKVTEHIETILKQARILAHANQAADQPKDDDKDSGKAKPRKRSVKKKVDVSGVQVQEGVVSEG
jgi:hypothetical protein